ncbi:DoxX family membrane protein [candidate division KSB1 bacterium]|nr:DoxX family membrane protein [candidate division KSB1 bacterium]
MNSAQKARLTTILDWLCRGIIAAIFLLAAWPKLMDPAGFAKSIQNYKVVLPLIGQNYINLAAIFLPALELVAGLGLLWPRTKRAAAWLCAALLVFFIIMVTQAVLRGFNIDCGCFGVGTAGAALAQKTGWSKVIENSILLAMAVWVATRNRKLKTEN